MKHSSTLNHAVLAVLQLVFTAAVFGACGAAIALFSTTTVTLNTLYSYSCADLSRLNGIFMTVFAVCAFIAVSDSYLKKLFSK